MLAASLNTQYSKVTFAVGTTDCAGQKPFDNLSNDIRQLVPQVKAVNLQGDVWISSILPCVKICTHKAVLRNLTLPLKRSVGNGNVSQLQAARWRHK